MARPTTEIATTHFDEITDSPATARADLLALVTAMNQIIQSWGIAGGIATLGSDGLVPDSQLSSLNGGALLKTGGVLQGSLTLAEDPTTDLHAATKRYVDTKEAFPRNTQMLFRQSTAPTGWTKLTTADDAVLRLVSGNATDRLTGVGVVGVRTGFSTDQNLGQHTLTEAQIPGHRHFVAFNQTRFDAGEALPPNRAIVDQWLQQASNAYALQAAPSGAEANLGLSSRTGGNQPHSHTLGFSIKYVDVIVARKD